MDVVKDNDHIRTTLIGIGFTDEEAAKELEKMARETATTEVAKEIAAKRGVSLHHAYKLARQEEPQAPIPTSFSTKDQILEALYRINANAGISAGGLASQLKAMDVHTNLTQVTALLWDLQKQEHVKFVEQHHGTGSQLTKIRLTPRGRAYIVKKRGTPQQAVERTDGVPEKGVSHNNRHGGTHQAGIDKTYFRNHRKVAEGGPIEIVVPGRKTPELVPETPYKPNKPEPLGDPLPQNMKAPFPVTDETSAGGTPSILPTSTSILGTSATTDTPTQYRVEITPANYPIIESLLRLREEKEAGKANAQKMLDAASMISDVDPTTADELTEKAAKLEGRPWQNWELEVLRFVDEVNGNGTSQG